MRNPMSPMARAGFTLIEVLVTLVLMALLVGVVVPSVINQLDKGEPTRVAQDLEAIRSGTKLFRVDVKRYPATLEQLTESPTTVWDSAGDINKATITAGLQDRWEGPYVEGSAVTDTLTTLATVLGGQVQPIFGSRQLAGADYLTVLVTGLSPTDVQNVSALIDGDTITTDDDTGGRLRISAAEDTLVFLAVPIN